MSGLTPDLDKVLVSFCWLVSCTPEDMTGRSQSRPITRRRHEAMYLMRYLCHASIGDIAGLFGRDYATAHAGISAVADAMQDTDYAGHIRDIASTIRQEERCPKVATADVRRAAAVGVLADASLSDGDARTAVLILLRSAGGNAANPQLHTTMKGADDVGPSH